MYMQGRKVHVQSLTISLPLLPLLPFHSPPLPHRLASRGVLILYLHAHPHADSLCVILSSFCRQCCGETHFHWQPPGSIGLCVRHGELLRPALQDGVTIDPFLLATDPSPSHLGLFLCMYLGICIMQCTCVCASMCLCMCVRG